MLSRKIKQLILIALSFSILFGVTATAVETQEKTFAFSLSVDDELAEKQ